MAQSERERERDRQTDRERQREDGSILLANTILSISASHNPHKMSSPTQPGFREVEASVASRWGHAHRHLVLVAYSLQYNNSKVHLEES